MDYERQEVTPKGDHLFPDSSKARYGEERQARSLFLPNLLQQESSEKNPLGDAAVADHIGDINEMILYALSAVKTGRLGLF
jgi:hypothetical protein